MKKIKSFILAAVAFALVAPAFTACSSDDDKKNETVENIISEFSVNDKMVAEQKAKSGKNVAVLLVAFGSTWNNAFLAFDKTKAAYEAAFPNADVYVCFSSDICINRASVGENYDDNGNLVREGHYVNGDRQGAFRYYEDGQKVVEETWSKGVLRDKLVRLKVPEEMFVSVNDINFMVPQGKNKTLVYLPDGTKLLDEEEPERLYDHVGDGRFTLANKEARIMVATELIVGTTRDSEGREILSLDPMPDFVIYPDEDCVKMLKSLQMQKETIDAGGQFDFD